MSNSIVIRKNSGNSLTIVKSGSVSTTLAPATNATLGGIIVGGNLSITGNGVLSVADTFQPKTSCVTYGLTDTLLPSGPNKFYVTGEHVVQSGKNFYTGLRGRKTAAGSYLSPTTYGVGGYNVDSNGTPTTLSTIETSGTSILLSSADLAATAPSAVAATVTVNSAGYLAFVSSNGSLNGASSLYLQDGIFKVSACNTGFLQMAGNNNSIGLSYNDFTFNVAGQSDFNKGVSIKRRSTTSSIVFPYSVSNGTGTFDFSSGLLFDDGDPLSAATEFQHTYTNRFSNATSSTSIRLVRNNAELTYAEVIQVKTPNSILTQGYADARYQAAGNYVTSANLTFANISATPTTLAGYGITDGLTSSNLTPYLTISSANSTYAVLGHTHSIANITGLQTALDAKLPSANFTYANLTGTPNLTLYLTTANASATYQPLGNYATTSCLTFSNITGKPTTLAGYGITDGLTASNLTPYLTSSTAASTYLPSANFTYANITGKPTLATVATSGSYTDLSNLPAAYSLPTATTTTLGGVKVDGSSVTISNGTISVSTSYAGTVANSFTGAQNLQDNELIRAKIRDYSETVSSPTISSGTLTLNLETSNIFTVSLNAAITTLTISNPPASGSGGSFTLIFTADGTARAVTWPASIKWAGGTAPTLTSTSGKVDSFAFFSSDGGTTWQGYVGGQNF